MQIGFYKSSAKTERNRGYAVVYAYNEDWPEGTLKRRGLLGHRRYERDAHQCEINERAASKRAVSWKYQTLDALIADEILVGTDPATIAEIEKALRW